MRIETSRKAILFDSIPEKEIFTHNSQCYMRLSDFWLHSIDKDPLLCNAVNLETGEFDFFESRNTVVFYPKAKLILK